MSNLFYRGDFNKYKISDSELRKSLTESFNFSAESASGFKQTTVFISHKHNDLEDLKGVIGYLEKECDVSVYIDSSDEKMPEITSVITAERIKNKIKTCNKFILLATNAAIASKWCNWELGFGDAFKSKNNDIAILPMNDTNLSDLDYAGNEYMELYPTIVYMDGATVRRYSDEYILKDYYVKINSNITPLYEWLRK